MLCWLQPLVGYVNGCQNCRGTILARNRFDSLESTTGVETENVLFAKKKFFFVDLKLWQKYEFFSERRFLYLKLWWKYELCSELGFVYLKLYEILARTWKGYRFDSLLKGRDNWSWDITCSVREKVKLVFLKLWLKYEILLAAWTLKISATLLQ